MSALPLALFPATDAEIHPQLGETKFVLPEDCSFVSLDEWVEKSKQADVLVQGFPHNTAFFEPHRDWLSKELTPKPGDYTQAGDMDIVLHIRWGDYFKHFKARYAYPLSAVFRLLSSLTYDRCLIVTDTPDNELLASVTKEIRGTLISESVDYDYRTLYYAPRLIMSPSHSAGGRRGPGKPEKFTSLMGFWKKEYGFALDLAEHRVKRFDAGGRIL